MKPFRIWIEQLRRDEQAHVQKIYDMAIKQLLGSARDQLHLSLSDIEDDSAEPGKPPSKKGPMVVLDKLNSAQIFNKLQNLGNTDLTSRAQQTQTWLNKIANDQRVGPKDTVGELLNRLFGKDATDTYGKRTWQTDAQATPQPPQNNIQPPPQPMPNPQTPAPLDGQNPMVTPDMLGTGALQSPNGPFPPKPPIA